MGKNRPDKLEQKILGGFKKTKCPNNDSWLSYRKWEPRCTRQFCTPNIVQPAQHGHNLCHSQQLQKSLQVKVAVSICQTAQYEKSQGITLHSSIFNQHPHSDGNGTNHLAILCGSQSSDSDSYNSLTVIARLLSPGHRLLFIRPRRAGCHWISFLLSVFSFGGSQRPFHKANREERLSARELE